MTQQTTTPKQETLRLGLVLGSIAFFVALMLSVVNAVAAPIIEEYAKEQLGMRKLESYQVEYVTLSEGDKVVVNEGADNISWWEAIFGSGDS